MIRPTPAKVLAGLIALAVLVMPRAAHAVTTLDLDGPWTLRQAGEDHAIPATVPGVVQTDLLNAGEIPDPFHGKNEDELQWIGEAAWTYSRTFTVPADLLAKKHVALRCEGLDTVAAVRVNGREVGTTDNMFRTYEFDVRPLLKVGENTVTVTFSPVGKYIEKQIADAKATLSGPSTWYEGMPMVRKPVYFEGWDFGPRFFTAGIWRPIRLVAWDAARVTHVAADVTLAGDLADGTSTGADLAVSADVDADPSAKGLTATATISLDGKWVAEASGPVAGGAVRLSLHVENPKLWWPAGMGARPMYDLKVVVKDATGAAVDARSIRIGLRRVELLPKSADRPLRLRVNGREIFAKGANWIPPDMFPPRATAAHVRDLLRQAAGANFNSIRGWGGGYPPDESFFDASDELGLLVWMDFPYACKPYPIGNPHFVENVRVETADIVRNLRHHPSMAVWCGNNEVDGIVTAFGLMGRVQYDQLFHDLIGGIVTGEYPAAQYVGGSPEAGDEHNWWVWHIGADFEKYRESLGWMTEFGFQSFPVPATVDAYTTPADRDSVKSGVMVFHQNNKNGNDNILGQMAKYFRPAKDFDSTLWLSQINQAYGMAVGVEHWRADWPRSSGAYVWQFDDCWPGPTWACVDYFGRPKAVLYRLRHAYAPLLVTAVLDGKAGRVPLRVVSEFDKPQTVAVRWKLTDLTGKTLKAGASNVKVPAGTQSTAGPTLDLSSEVSAAGADRVLLWAEATAPGVEKAVAAMAFVRPKELDLADPELSVAVDHAGDGFDITLKASRPALWAWLTLGGDPDARFSDNFIPIDPAAPARIHLTPSKPTDAAAIRKSLAVRSLYDTYTHGRE